MGYGKMGKYIYCIIGARQDRGFGPIGIGAGDNEVATVGLGDLAVVASDTGQERYPVSRENLLSHQKVIERVMKEFSSVLPVRFCTIAPGNENIRNLLERRQKEFKALLDRMEFKMELGVKAVWKDMDSVFREIAEGDREIASLKQRALSGKGSTFQAKMELGRMVELALAKKRQAEADAIMSVLRGPTFDWRAGRTSGERMVLNASFLVDGAREREFDSLLEDLSEDRKERMKFMYAGPLPPYNFVNVVIHPREWEA